MTYQLTITGESLDELMAKVGTGKPQPKALSTDDMIEELKQRLEKEGRTLVVRAQRNSKKKADDAVEEETDEDGSDEADDDQEAVTSEKANDEADESDEAPVSESVDFDTAMQAVKAAVLDTENTELAAKVRRTMGKFMADRSHITKMNEITKADDQEAFCELVESELPELFSDDEAGF